MAKKRNKKKSSAQATNQPILFAVLAAAVIIVLALVMFQGSDDSQPVATGDAAVEMVAEGGLIQPLEYVSQFEDGTAEHFLVDVRTPEEFDAGHIEGSVNIPLQELADRYDEFPQDMPIVVYCRSGNRSGTATEMLNAEGFDNVYDIDGGIVLWQQDGLQLVMD